MPWTGLQVTKCLSVEIKNLPQKYITLLLAVDGIYFFTSIPVNSAEFIFKRLKLENDIFKSRRFV